MSALFEGAIFAGRYRIQSLIARGGMGAVYEAVHTETNRRKALKIMRPHIFESDDLRERFQREVRIAADIESDHIVDVSDAGVDEASQTPFMVMELLRGEDLGKYLKRIGPLPFAEVLTYLRQVALALDKTHAASIVHRDLKPDNLFLTHRDDGSPRIKILDFGIAKVVAEGATTGQGTESIGTPIYMAPEQFYSGTRITPAADIFALGLVAYTLLVGLPYWHSERTGAGGVFPFIALAVHGPKESAVQRAREQGVELPAAFDEWFFRAVATKPEDRFGSAGETIVALNQVWIAANAAGPVANHSLSALEMPPDMQARIRQRRSDPRLIAHYPQHKKQQMTAATTFAPTESFAQISKDPAASDDEATRRKRISKRSLLTMTIAIADVILISVLGGLAYRSWHSRLGHVVKAVQVIPKISAPWLDSPIASPSAAPSTSAKVDVMVKPAALSKPALPTAAAKNAVAIGTAPRNSDAKPAVSAAPAPPSASAPSPTGPRKDLIGRK